jgi:hypothetical protein
LCCIIRFPRRTVEHPRQSRKNLITSAIAPSLGSQRHSEHPRTSHPHSRCARMETPQKPLTNEFDPGNPHLSSGKLRACTGPRTFPRLGSRSIWESSSGKEKERGRDALGELLDSQRRLPYRLGLSVVDNKYRQPTSSASLFISFYAIRFSISLQRPPFPHCESCLK